MDHMTYTLYLNLDNTKPTTLGEAASATQERYNFINDGRRSVSRKGAEELSIEWAKSRNITLNIQ